jgi:hypothetical protein
MKKVFNQTVRDIKREVNKNVLKVPRIEQKILDATSNEPWGPHGSLLADIAQATHNYHEYQMIMNIVWKRINDTGKNWRHVYKGLIVLDYLVAHGTERVIDDIREHAYQISVMLSTQFSALYVHNHHNVRLWQRRCLVSYLPGSLTLCLNSRHLLTSSTLILLGEIKAAMCGGNPRALLV